MRKTVLVTGSSSGIGKEIARILAKDYDVILHYNSNENSTKLLKEELDKEYNRDYLMVKCDLSKEDEIDNMLDIIYTKYDSIDILINNAGIAIDTLFEDKTKDNFMKTLDINLIAPFLLCKKIGPKMVDNKYGVIINISSTNGIDTPYIESIDYDASKAALNALTHDLAMQWGPYIHVNAIAPGFIGTESELDGYDEDFLKQECEKILVERYGKPEEVAYLVKFLISEEADYINNTIIRIDGGQKGSC